MYLTPLLSMYGNEVTTFSIFQHIALKQITRRGQDGQNKCRGVYDEIKVCGEVRRKYKIYNGGISENIKIYGSSTFFPFLPLLGISNGIALRVNQTVGLS